MDFFPILVASYPKVIVWVCGKIPCPHNATRIYNAYSGKPFLKGSASEISFDWHDLLEGKHLGSVSYL